MCLTAMANANKVIGTGYKELRSSRSRAHLDNVDTPETLLTGQYKFWLYKLQGFKYFGS